MKKLVVFSAFIILVSFAGCNSSSCYSKEEICNLINAERKFQMGQDQKVFLQNYQKYLLIAFKNGGSIPDPTEFDLMKSVTKGMENTEDSLREETLRKFR